MMKGKKNSSDASVEAVYCEETVRVPFVVMLLLVVLVVVPSGWLIRRENAVGVHSTDVAEGKALARSVMDNLKALDSLMVGDGDQMGPSEIVTLIVPEILIVDASKPTQPEQAVLSVELKGIYWNPTHPLADIDGETVSVGDEVANGYIIVKIGKTSVHFKGKDGKIVVKNMYEGLL